MLEKMDELLENRLVTYDEHMLTEIEGAGEFYPYTASLLPREVGVAVLDLGCGTGLELEAYLSCNPRARITGIDLSKALLDKLAAKFPNEDLHLICGSYFDVDLGAGLYDAAVSVESLHHFTGEKKLTLYRKLFASLKTDGYFVLTDYFAPSEAFEQEAFATLERLKREQGICDDEFYHYDTPLTVEHETELLQTAGFSEVRILKNWGATYTILAKR